MPKRLLQLLGVCALAFTMLGAGTPATSFDKIGHQLMCQCGCGQVLLECNHVGCPVSGPMIEELKAQMASGLATGGILGWFVNKYGPVVLAAPIRGGFDNAAWIVPFAVFGLGVVAVLMLARLWRQRHATLASANRHETTAPHISDAFRDRIRQETDLP